MFFFQVSQINKGDILTRKHLFPTDSANLEGREFIETQGKFGEASTLIVHRPYYRRRCDVILPPVKPLKKQDWSSQTVSVLFIYLISDSTHY